MGVRVRLGPFSVGSRGVGVRVGPVSVWSPRRRRGPVPMVWVPGDRRERRRAKVRTVLVGCGIAAAGFVAFVVLVAVLAR